MSLKLMFITNDVTVAKIAEIAGVDRIFIDLEKLGKETRQKHVDSVKSNHTIADIRALKSQIKFSQLLVRVNPINPESGVEINAVIENGADILMLPMFKTASEVESFISLVSGRAKTMLLLETEEAENDIENILEIPGIDEIHIGLNDLHLAHKLRFMFELLSNGTVEKLSQKISRKGLPYGFGGISSIGSGVLPAERILAEHYRLGSSMVILSRSFCNTTEVKDLKMIEVIFNEGVSKIREFEKFLSEQPEAYFIKNKNEVERLIVGLI